MGGRCWKKKKEEKKIAPPPLSHILKATSKNIRNMQQLFKKPNICVLWQVSLSNKYLE